MLFSCSGPTTTPQTKTLVGSAEPEIEEKRGLLWYLISFDDDEKQMRVRVRLANPLPRTKFYLPDQWAGRNDWSKRISIDGIEGPEGPRFLTIDRDQGIVEADGRQQPWIELAYRVSLKSGDRLFPQIENGNVAAFVPTFAILPSAHVLEGLKEIPIEVHAPQQWRIAATWRLERHASSKQSSDRSVWGFIADDAVQLNDAFLTAGPNLSVHETDHLRIVTPTDFYEGSEPLFDSADKVMRFYNARFGSLGRSTMFVRPRRKGEHTEFVGMGRRGGFVVDIDPSPKKRNEMALLVAHEAFHLWNGHWVVPHPKHEPHTRWFKEGVTHYIALKSLTRLGLVSERFALNELAQTGAAYQQNRVVVGGRPTQSDQARYPYQLGTLFGLQLDATLNVENQSEIEDWFEHVSRDAQSTRGGYDVSSLHGALEAASGGNANVHALWQAHIIGNRAFDLRAVYGSVDLHWLPPRLNQPAKLVALDRANPVYRRLWKRNEQH